MYFPTELLQYAVYFSYVIELFEKNKFNFSNFNKHMNCIGCCGSYRRRIRASHHDRHYQICVRSKDTQHRCYHRRHGFGQGRDRLCDF